MKSISIKFLFGGALAIIAVLVVLLGGAVHRLEKASEAVTHANEARYSSYLLADELRQSSDDLTRLVRTYTVTGDPKWAAQYQEVLDIRNGVQPRPNGYEKIYWDFRAADMAASKGTGPAVALADLMKRAGFSAAELGKLDDAAALSNALVKTEVVAMDLVKRHLEASANGTAQEGDTDLASARAMVHDAQYHANKAKIMQPVDEFLVLLDQRTQGAIANAQARKMRWFYVTAVLSFCLLGTLVLGAGVLVCLSAGQRFAASGHSQCRHHGIGRFVAASANTRPARSGHYVAGDANHARRFGAGGSQSAPRLRSFVFGQH